MIDPTKVRCMGFGKPGDGTAYQSITRHQASCCPNCGTALPQTEKFELTYSMLELICLETPQIRYDMAQKLETK